MQADEIWTGGTIMMMDQWRRTYASENLRLGFAKLFLDGVAPGFTASFIEPYLAESSYDVESHNPDASLLIPPAHLNDMLVQLDRRGYVVKMHAGRPGWQSFFMKLGLDTYICDAIERGRAGWSPYPEIYDAAPIFRTQNEAWELFRFGVSKGYSTDPYSRKPFAGLLFPLAHLDAFGAQLVPRWTEHGCKTLEAYYEALDRIGPVWLVAHSQGGNLALEAAAAHPDLIKGIVAIEPASAPTHIGNAYQVCLG